MPADGGFDVLFVVALAFIALVSLGMATVGVSRAVRLGRSGPEAERLRRQLLLQRRSAMFARRSAAIDSGQSLMDLQQQQIVTDIANSSINSTPPS